MKIIWFDIVILSFFLSFLFEAKAKTKNSRFLFFCLFANFYFFNFSKTSVFFQSHHKYFLIKVGNFENKFMGWLFATLYLLLLFCFHGRQQKGGRRYWSNQLKTTSAINNKSDISNRRWNTIISSSPSKSGDDEMKRRRRRRRRRGLVKVNNKLPPLFSLLLYPHLIT